MRMIITLLARKGGAGKTTIAVNLADALRQLGHSVALVDVDPQRSAASWLRAWKEFPVLLDPTAVDEDQTEFVIFDTPGELGRISKVAVEISDLIILPIRPSPLDIEAAEQTVAFCAKLKRAEAIRLLVAQKVVGTVMGRQAREAIAAAGLKIFDTEITQRIAHVESVAAGVPIRLYAAQSPAVAEFMGLAKEILYGETATQKDAGRAETTRGGESTYSVSAP